MDLIAGIASQLGLPGDAAQAVAGGLLGTIKEQAEAHLGAGAAADLSRAVPELPAWQQALQGLTGGGGGGGAGGLGGLAAQALGGGGFGGLAAQALGGLGGGESGGLGGLAAQALGGLAGGGGLGALGALLGGGGEAQGLLALVSKLGLDPQKLGGIVPIVLDFLKTRLPPELVEKLGSALPLLSALGGQGGGGLGGLVGGLLGGR